MFDLFKAEVRRFGKGALILALLHFAVAVSVIRVQKILQGPVGWLMMALMLYLLTSMALAARQFGTYRQPARWLWLLHRPLARWKIFLALNAAAAVLGIVTLVLPLEMALVLLDRLGQSQVDVRHYVAGLHVLLFALIAWQVAAITLLARRPAVAVLLILPLMLSYLATASAYALFLPALAMLAMTSLAMYASFQPDRQVTPARPWHVLAVALPLALALHITFTYGVSFLYRAGGAAFGWDPSFPANIKAGNYIDVLDQSLRPNGVLLKSELGKLQDARVAAWQAELEKTTPYLLSAGNREHMVRNQIVNTAPPVWRDRSRTAWYFSHDLMRFVGRTDRGAQLTFGAQGEGDATPFDSLVASVSVFSVNSEVSAADWSGYRAYVSPTELHLSERGQTRPHLIQRLQGEEKFASAAVVEVKGRFYVLTNLRLLAFELEQGKAPRTVLSLPLPGPLSDLTRVTLSCIAKACFHAFVYGRDLEFGAQGSKLSIFYVPDDGAPELLVQRTFANILGTWYVDKDWWISPLIFSLLELPQVVIDTGLIADAGKPAGATHLLLPRPPEAKVAALAAALLSLFAALWWTKGMPRPYRLAWAIGCLLFSLPALASLMVLHARPALAAKRSAVAQAA